MNFQQLRYVRAVADAKSFHRAAEQCGVTQPTLSNGIAQLEDEFGQRLFDRTTRAVSLTEFGQHVLPSLLDTLNAQSALVATARAYTHPAQRLIRLGLSPLVNIRLIKLMVEALLDDNPKIEVVFREMNLGEMYQSLDNGQLEFVIGPVDDRPSVSGEHRHLLLYSEPLIFIPKGGSQAVNAKQQTILINEIATETLVMVPDACGLARVTRALFKRQKMLPKEYSGKALSYGVLEEWAGLGIGAAILPKSKIGQTVASSASIETTRGVAAMISYQASWRRSAVPEIEKFADSLVRKAPSIVAGLR